MSRPATAILVSEILNAQGRNGKYLMPKHIHREYPDFVETMISELTSLSTANKIQLFIEVCHDEYGITHVTWYPKRASTFQTDHD